MATWNESEYISRAAAIAKDFAASQKPLTDLVEKVAREETLQPDEIRSLGRLTNVETFKELFRLKTGADKVVEFEIADPEAVIRRLVSDAGAEPQSANIFNDKLASEYPEIPDYMREKRLGGTFDLPESVKVASDDAPVRTAPSYAVKHGLEQLKEHFTVERLVEGGRWADKVAALAKTFNKAVGYGPSLAEFEKDAYAVHGANAVPELVGLHQDLRSEFVRASDAKIASYVDRRVVDDGTTNHRLLKEAQEARRNFEKYVAGLEWVETSLQKFAK
jgi:hypothetical protein